MKLRKYLLLPRLLFYAARAPRDQRLAWDRYWSAVTSTGFDGDVRWAYGLIMNLGVTIRFPPEYKETPE